MTYLISVFSVYTKLEMLSTISAPDKEQLIAQVEVVLNEWHKLEKE